MARIRYLKPEFFTDTNLSALPLEARVLYAGLWPQMDCNGVVEGDARLIKVWVYPLDECYTVAMVESWIDLLLDAGRLQSATHRGKRYLRCPRFKNHQKIHHAESAKHQIPEESWQDTSRPLSAPSQPPTNGGQVGGSAPSQPPTNLPLTLTLMGIGTGIGIGIDLPRDSKNEPPQIEWPYFIEEPKPEESIATLWSEMPSASPPVPAEKPLPEVFAIRDHWCREYQDYYKQAYGWDHGRDGRHAKTLLKKATCEEIIKLVSAYYQWTNADVVTKGHSFSDGWHSFCELFRQLRADLAAPERHALAFTIRKKQREAQEESHGQSLVRTTGLSQQTTKQLGNGGQRDSHTSRTKPLQQGIQQKTLGR